MFALISILSLVAMCSGRICSNDTRTGLDLCDGYCPNMGKCRLVGGNFLINLELSEQWVTSQSLTSSCKMSSEANTTYPMRDRVMSMGRNVSVLGSEQCQNCSFNRSCSGDSLYCASMQCNNSKPCYCVSQLVEQTYKTYYSNAYVDFSYVPVCYGLVWTPDNPIIPKAVRDWSSVDKNPRRPKRNIGVQVSWEQPVMTVFVTQVGNIYATINKPGLSQILFCDQNQNSFTISDQWFDTTEPIIYNVYSNMTLLTTGTLETTRFIVCKIPDCVFCDEFAYSFTCFSGALKAVVILFFIFFAIIVLLCLVILFMVVKSAMNAGVNVNLTSKEVLRAVIMMSMLMGAGAQGCDYGFSINAPMNSCTMLPDGSTNCLVTQSMLFTLAYPGMTVCYDIMTTEGNTLGKVSVKYLDSVRSLNLNLDYWTSGWDFRSDYVSGCPNSGNCQGGFDCNSVSGWSDSLKATLNNQITSVVTTLPGVSGCLSTCGCAGCGCFFCSDSCTYWRWGLLPKSSEFKVMGVSSYTDVPSVQICSYQGLSQSGMCEILSIGSNLPTNIASGVAQVLGSLSSPTSLFGSNKFIIRADGDLAYYGPASAANNPIAGNVGDIQSVSQAGLTNPSLTGFVFAPNIASVSASGRTAQFLFNNNGLSRTNTYPTLPTSVGGVQWQMSGNNAVEGINPNPGTLLLSMTIVNASFTEVFNQVCPKIEIVNVTGCYSCENGFAAYVSGITTCLPGTCRLVSLTSNVVLSTQSLTLSTVGTITKITGTSSEKDGLLSLKCSNGAYESIDTQFFTLYDPVPIVDPNGTVIGYMPGSTNVNNGLDLGNFWLNLDTGETVGFVIGLVAGAVLVVLLVLALVWLVTNLNWKYKTLDYSDEELKNIGKEDVTELDEESKMNEIDDASDSGSL